MVLVQNYEMSSYKPPPSYVMHIGSGAFLNPYQPATNITQYPVRSIPYAGGALHPYYNRYKVGHGIGDIFTSALGFLKNNSGLIADGANAAAGIASVAKTIKDIKRDDEKLYELKGIKDEVKMRNNPEQYTKTQLELAEKIRRGEGLKQLEELHKGGGIKLL